jgi:hypothetical protein
MRAALVASLQVAVDVEADILAGLRRQPLVQVDRVLVQLADGVAHVEQRQQSGGMPGGSGGQFRALEQHDVLPAFFGQVIERADTDHAAADDDHPGMAFHNVSPARNCFEDALDSPRHHDKLMRHAAAKKRRAVVQGGMASPAGRGTRAGGLG